MVILGLGDRVLQAQEGFANPHLLSKPLARLNIAVVWSLILAWLVEESF
jgi:hypothetical protein